jgi:hypothetical protein
LQRLFGLSHVVGWNRHGILSPLNALLR